ncbi:MAG TPA: hypothetical protein VJZ71_04055 [Phycisphaerae bacterium]|nr:hypothetical protein [Phycisphaerae bacterium]
MDSRDPGGDSTSPAENRRASRGWVRRHPVVTGFLVFTAMLVAAVWFANDQAERALERRIAAIRDRGEPVTVQDILYAQPRISDDENMAFQLASAGRASMAVRINEEESKSIPYLGNGRLPPTGERWNDDMLMASDSYLDRADEALGELHKALKLERSYLALNWSTPAINVLIPELSDLRQASKILVLESLIAAQKDQRQRAEQLLLDMTPMTRALDGSSTLIGALVQLATTSLMQDSVERCINQCGLSDASLRKLHIALQESEAYPDMKQAYYGERIIFLDTLQWVRTSGPSAITTLTGSQGSPGPESLWRYIPILPPLDISCGLDQYNLLVSAVGTPNGRTIKAITTLDGAAERLPMYCVMSRIMLPSLSRSIVLWVRTVGSNRALRAAIAAERFRLANDCWPEKLDDLVPKYLDAVPLDPIDGKSIRYAIIPEGMKTWTICDDDKNEDNGGDVRRLESRTGNRTKDRPMDYGWVILNPSLRNRPAPTTTQPATSQPTSRPVQ